MKNLKARYSNKVVYFSLMTSAFLSTHAELVEPSLILIGDLEGGLFYSAPDSTSGNGLVITGNSNSASGPEAFLWMEGSGMIGLGDLEGGRFSSAGSGISRDGTVVAGRSSSANGTEAFRWTKESGMIGLGDFEGGDFQSAAYDVSADGSVIIGYGSTSNGYQAFRWTEEMGMIGLGDLAGGQNSSTAYAVSANGSVIAGYSNSINGNEAFRWTEATGMIGLGNFDDAVDGYDHSIAYGISPNGRVIVGQGVSGNGLEAFRWTKETGMVGLGDLEGGRYDSTASGVSVNGAVIVGVGYTSNGQEAFRWTESTGIQTVEDWLTESGVTIEDGFTLKTAQSVSDDGSVVVGTGLSTRGYEAWLARGGSGVISIDEFTQTFGTTASVTQTSLALPSTIMNGSHHRVLMEQDFLDQNQMVWVNGDFAAHDRRDADLWIGEVGGAYDISPHLRGGIGVGYGEMEQDLTFDGSHELDGQYLLGELDYQIPETQIILSLLGIYGDWDADIERGYTNGGIADKSKGSTDVETISARIRVDWVDAFDVLGWSFSPRAAFSVTRIETDSYTETGGGFPASFDSMSHTAEEFRFGLTGERMLTEKTAVRGIFEAVYRFDEDNDDFSGEVIGLFDFSISGASNEQDWIRGGAEVSHRIAGNQMLTATIFGATRGEDPEMSIGLNYQLLF